MVKKITVFDKIGKKTIIGSWLLFFSLLLSVYVVSLVSLSGYTRNVISKNLHKTMGFSLSQISDSVDGFIYKADSFRSSVMLNEKTKEMLTTDYNTRTGKYSYYQYKDIIQRISIANDDNFNVFLWFEDAGIIVTPSSAMTAEDYYDSFFFDYFDSFDEFNEIVLNSSYKFYGADLYESDSIFMYLSQIIYPTASGKRIKCVAFCNADELMHFSKVLYSTEDYAFVIRNKDKIAYCMTDIGDINLENLAEKLDSDTVRLGGKNYVCTSFASNKNDVSFSYLVSRNAFMREIQKFNNMTMAILFLILVINLFVVYRFTKRNYKPINNLLSLFEIQRNGQTNELHQITNSVIEYKDSQAKIIEQLDIQNKVAQHYVLLNLILNNSLLSDEDYHIIFGDKEPFKYNYVVALRGVGKVAEEVYSELSGIMEDFFCRDGLIVPRIYFDNSLILLVNTSTENIDEIDSSLKALNDFSDINYNVKIHAGVSRICVDFFEISEKYIEAKKALKYAIGSGLPIAHFEKISSALSTNYYYPPDIEKQMLESMKQGDFDKADKILEVVYNTNFNERHIEPVMEDYLFYNIIGTFNKFIDSVPVSCSLRQINAANLPLMLSSCNSREEKKRAVSNIILLFQNALNEESLNKDLGLIKTVKKYILQNYSNPNLNVSATALYFETRQDYLSRIFKQKENIGLLEYINNVRMQRAANLLITSDKSATEISESVGFENYRTFSRRFSKHYGMSPQLYREKKGIRQD